ncbi:hypothetical protein MTR_6g036477 [Medicago truncatula]|uniref:Uncharacterized protein n=1 Tax=Medicago truncatula TaxID=3880 RepID=A0A072UJA4_MEDTR|nr:hypothetical protein MTR_6g036477 [Medicago truncatula]
MNMIKNMKVLCNSTKDFKSRFTTKSKWCSGNQSGATVAWWTNNPHVLRLKPL